MIVEIGQVIENLSRILPDVPHEVLTEELLHRSWEAFHIEDSRAVGDLMGAIHGVRYTGFIGEVYRRFPFPSNPGEFKQKPEGSQNRPLVETLLSGRAKRTSIPFQADAPGKLVRIGPHRFTRETFQELILYVWRGGYPRWAGESRPDYVIAMKEALEASESWLFKGMVFP